MEKRYIAFNGTNGNSGIQTHEKVIAWATDQLTKSSGLTIVHVAEVFEVVERKSPPIEVRTYEPPSVEAENVAQPKAKAA